MKKFLHINLLFAVVAIVGLSFSVISCNSSSGGGGVTNPQSGSGSIVDTVLSLTAGNDFRDTVAFNLTQTGVLTITITGPAGSAPAYAISSGSSSIDPYSRLNDHHHGSSDPEPDPQPDPQPDPEPDPEPTQSGNSGVNISQYTPQESGVHSVTVQDGNKVGGPFSVVITQ